MTNDITDPGEHKVDPIGGKSPNIPTEESSEKSFQTHMEAKPTNAAKSQAPSPMDIANVQKNPSTPPTLETIQNQAGSVSSSLGDIKSQLHTKGLKLKNHEKTLLSKKLRNANSHINTAKKHLVDPDEEGTKQQEENFDQKLYKSRNPIAKFLAMVSDGQHQMVSAAETIKKLNSSGKSVQPGQLLLVQIKLNKAQQELAYTSTILGNATSMIKTLMNIQI